MKKPIEYKDEILKSIDYLLSRRYFDLDQGDEVLFERLYHEHRVYSDCSDFVVRIKDGGYYHIHVWTSENDLNFVKDNIDNVDYVRMDTIGALEDTIVGDIYAFMDSINSECSEYHYANEVDVREATITREEITNILTRSYDTTDIMKSLKKELLTVESLINENGYYDISFENRIDFVFALNYLVILNDGTYFYISTDSSIFPKIDFNDIVYIRKWCINNPDENNKVVDSDGNMFECTWVFDSDTEVFNKYCIDVMNEIDTD